MKQVTDKLKETIKEASESIVKHRNEIKRAILSVAKAMDYAKPNAACEDLLDRADCRLIGKPAGSEKLAKALEEEAKAQFLRWEGERLKEQLEDVSSKLEEIKGYI